MLFLAASRCVWLAMVGRGGVRLFSEMRINYSAAMMAILDALGQDPDTRGSSRI